MPALRRVGFAGGGILSTGFCGGFAMVTSAYREGGDGLGAGGSVFAFVATGCGDGSLEALLGEDSASGRDCTEAVEPRLDRCSFSAACLVGEGVNRTGAPGIRLGCGEALALLPETTLSKARDRLGGAISVSVCLSGGSGKGFAACPGSGRAGCSSI